MANLTAPTVETLPPTSAFYREVLDVLQGSSVPFLIGGGFAVRHYTGIMRETKDLDVFVRKDDVERILSVLDDAGYRTEMCFPHWLAKAKWYDEFIDVIFSSGNGLAEVDDTWFADADEGSFAGHRVLFCPAEEMIWSKAFIMERERYDGADIAHLLRALAPSLDWTWLLHRFGEHWRVLFSHLVLFGYVYRAERLLLPAWVMDELGRRLASETDTRPPPGPRTCHGTLLSRAQYLTDIRDWGYGDARLRPHGTMTSREVEIWTRAFTDSR